MSGIYDGHPNYDGKSTWLDESCVFNINSQTCWMKNLPTNRHLETNGRPQRSQFYARIERSNPIIKAHTNVQTDIGERVSEKGLEDGKQLT